MRYSWESVRHKGSKGVFPMIISSLHLHIQESLDTLSCVCVYTSFYTCHFCLKCTGEIHSFMQVLKFISVHTIFIPENRCKQ